MLIGLLELSFIITNFTKKNIDSYPNPTGINLYKYPSSENEITALIEMHFRTYFHCLRMHTVDLENLDFPRLYKL